MNPGKELLRQEMLNKRNSLCQEELDEKSKAIFNMLMLMDIYRNSNVIMCYMDFRNEVKTGDFIRTSLKNGKRIAVSVTGKDINGEKTLIPCEIKDIEHEMERSRFGILEPRKESRRVLNPENIDIVIVPGIAFDLHKYRIGFGAGYYDRFLKTTGGNCIRIGVAFDFQVLDKIPTEGHDVQLDMIITEKRVIK
ncbi:MAG: 5-formyltetrahydrofolate cyclo-ligase [Clostridiaceae bacterium]|nr:5-formyltetrahydrofolate cyclo-ligase [Clostridiaceae bacterium]